MLSDGILRYLFVEWNPMGFMGIQRLPSSYSSESAEWKVLHEKKMAKVHFLHLVNFTEFCPFYIRYYFVSSGGIC